MVPLHLTAVLALSATAFAQSVNQITWASVVFVYHGEKYPDLTSGPYNLTPLGAQQLYDAGNVVRSRYVSPPANGSETTSSAPIDGLSANAIDNSQMYVLSADDEYVSGSALAFMQGLYPPTGSDAPFVDDEAILSNGSVDVYPLDGYQYPNIGTVSTLDFNYIWVAGNIECTAYYSLEQDTLLSPAYIDEVSNTNAFYQSLASAVFGSIDSTKLNYGYAWSLYEYALYQYNHNRTVAGLLSPADLAKLYNLASQQQFNFNTPNANTTVQAMAGRTYASIVLQQFYYNIASSGVSDKLTLLFGSFEPFISFFALSNLNTSPAAQLFTIVPQHGSIMAIELFSDSTTGQNTSTQYPTTDELYVRFLYRNGTGDTAPLISYPLFGRGNSEVDMSWSDFAESMSDFALGDVANWCSTCNADSMFCAAIESNTSPSSGSSTSTSKKGLSPAIGGVIGSTLTLALGILVAVVLGLCGFRLDYHEKRAKGVSVPDVGGIGVLRRTASGGAGGFKGAEKLASDTDLRLKGGAGASVVRHERVGSWELNENAARDKKHSSLDKQVESGRVESHVDYGRDSEDGLGNVNPFGDPVKPLDQV